ncbi:aquaporin-12B isoform X2 [Camelus ferus]|uniref:Aquaporin-12B isoform X2 n=2 Tax=Camelus TaxID=9836 RepID=A0A8B8T2V7_CAMFR|nr:aquaporin-12B isoform X2 [Camelus ferus]XP_045367455.1 aquaporin-12-like isoform X2 [Camelus bactrianus]
MAGLNVSLSFFFATFALCQVARRASKALLPRGAYAHFAREAAGAAQLGACCLEMRVLVEIGPWAGGFSPDLLLTLLFLLFLGHRATLDGASANPTVSLQEFLLAEASLPSTLLKLAAQALGMQAAGALTRLFWAWELSDMHVLQNLMDLHCSSALRTAVPHGALVEGSGAFFFHLTFLHLRNTLPVYRVPAVALLVTVMACAAGPLTSAFFNPTLAASVTFHCSGHTLVQYAQVYWLGPLTGLGCPECTHPLPDEGGAGVQGCSRRTRLGTQHFSRGLALPSSQAGPRVRSQVPRAQSGGGAHGSRGLSRLQGGWSWLSCCITAASHAFSRGTCSTVRRTSTESPE